MPWLTGHSLMQTQLMRTIYNSVIETRPYSVLHQMKYTYVVAVRIPLRIFIPRLERPVPFLITVSNKLNPHFCLTHRICICYANIGIRYILNLAFVKNTPMISSLPLCVHAKHLPPPTV